MQIGTPDELQSAPATPFVLHFIDDVNQMPANCQFVKRMGYKTDKPYVMCRPTVFDVSHPPHAFTLLSSLTMLAECIMHLNLCSMTRCSA